MMFDFREFIKRGLLAAVGHLMDYQIILNATGWYEKNVLTMEDLAEINDKIDEKNTPIENEPTEEPTESTIEEAE